MNVQFIRNVARAESNLMAPVPSVDLLHPDLWSNDDLDHGIVDLYAQRMEMVARQREHVRQEALDRMVVTQPFGRPFTAQSPVPEGSSEPDAHPAGLRRRLGEAVSTPRRRLATS